MKRILPIIFLCFATSIMQAQSPLVLTAERNAYRPGDEIEKQQVVFCDPGSHGKDLIWDFRHLQPINEDYLLRYFTPDSARMNLLCGMEHRTRYYYEQRDDTLWATGFENPTTLMEYVEPELKMVFPFTYGDTLRRGFTGRGEYSHRLALEVSGFTRTEADAEGELILPDAAIRKALRVRSLRHYTRLTPTRPEEDEKLKTEMTLDTYSWYAEGARYPVFESIRTSIYHGNTDTVVFTTSFYYPPQEQKAQMEDDANEENWNSPLLRKPEGDLEFEGAVFTEADLVPNPVVDVLRIKYRLTRNARIGFSVHNQQGLCMARVPSQAQPTGYHETPVDMSACPTGTYTIYVDVDDVVMSLNVVKK